MFPTSPFNMDKPLNWTILWIVNAISDGILDLAYRTTGHRAGHYSENLPGWQHP